MADNVCRNCKWAEWQMTAHEKPRVRKNMPGRCGYPKERIALPVCLSGVQRQVDHSAVCIWFNHEEQCRVWEKV